MLLPQDFIQGGQSHEGPLRRTFLPERVLQIGEGNFMRGFADWLIHQLNQNGLFQGSIVVVAPRPTGEHNINLLNRQAGLYTVWLRGLYEGEHVDRKEIVSSISRGINPYTHWQEFLGCAEKREIDIVISNTTESGLVYVPEALVPNQPVTSFPGKLTAYLYQRFQHFDGDRAAGMTVIPCELVDDNGDTLRSLVEKYASDWKLPQSFVDWVRQANHFCNTLVDRIVTGFPDTEEQAEVFAELGYEDRLLTVGEPFHLWAIEGNERLKQVWSFEQAGLNVSYVDDVTPYRLRKVRILNGAHTAMSALAFFAGIRTVREVVEDEVFGQFVRQLIFEEIIPSLESDLLDKASLNGFASSVLERFANPYIEHDISSLMLNGLSKIRVRIRPTMEDYLERSGTLPERLTLAFSALLLYYRNAETTEERWVIRDQQGFIEKLEHIWSREPQQGSQKTVESLLAASDIWEQDLNALPGLAQRVLHHIRAIRNNGVKRCIADMTGKQSTM